MSTIINIIKMRISSKTEIDSKTKICLVSISLQTPERKREDIQLKPDCIPCSF